MESGTYTNYVVVLLIWVLFRSIFQKTRPKLRLPPGPMGLPIIGHFHLLRQPLHHSLHSLSLRYGPLLHLSLASIHCVVVSSSDLAKHILKTHELSFVNRPPNAAITYLTYNASDLAFSPYGTYWKFIKKLCMSQLLNGVMLDQLRPLRHHEIHHFLNHLLEKARLGNAVDIGAELVRLANSVIVRMAFSKSFFDAETKDEALELARRVKDSAKLCGRFHLADYFRVFQKLDVQGFGKRLKEVREKSDSVYEAIIRERISNSNTPASTPRDILDVLLAVSQDPNSEVKLTRDNIKAFLADLMSGGTGTVAVGIEWAMAELINHPSIMEKARKEIDSVVGKERIVEESDIGRLHYLQAIVKETLRLHPPGPLIFRESTEQCSIGGYDIPEKTRVMINVWSIGRDPKYWENPLEFRPERFLMKENALDVRGQHYQLLPFGSGRRGCPGASLALNIFHTTLAALIHCFEFECKNVNNGTKLDMEEGHSIDLQRAHPLICVPKQRLTPFPSLA